MASNPGVSFPNDSLPTRPQGNPRVEATRLLRRQGKAVNEISIKEVLRRALELQKKINSKRPSTISLVACIIELGRDHHATEKTMKDRTFDFYYRLSKQADKIRKSDKSKSLDQCISLALESDPSLFEEYSDLTYGPASTDTIGAVISDAYEEAVSKTNSTDIPTFSDAANSFFEKHPEEFQRWLDSTN